VPLLSHRPSLQGWTLQGRTRWLSSERAAAALGAVFHTQMVPKANSALHEKSRARDLCWWASRLIY